MRELADAIIQTALDAAAPKRALERAWPAGWPGDQACRVIAFGKASREMFEVAARRCRDRISKAVVVTDRPQAMPKHHWLRSVFGAHPIPTHETTLAVEAILDCVMWAPAEEPLIALISGGGSSHLASPWPGIAMSDLAAVSEFLMRAGASIHEHNCVRRHVERLKGGRLLQQTAARQVEVFVMSDVIGNPLHDIASGPFAPDPTTFADAMGVLRKHDAAEISPAVTRMLDLGVQGLNTETPKPGDCIFDRVRHHVIASNRQCVDAIAAMLESRGVQVLDRRYDAQGEAQDWAAWLGERVRAARDEIGPCAWIIGGEPVVRVGDAKGRGGPSQEVALHAAKLLSGSRGTTLVAFSTDGVDGPSGNAGAIVDGGSWEQVKAVGIDPESALDRHDSATVHDRLGGVIRTGPTGTNLNHVAVLIAREEPMPASTLTCR